jgi:hypothetical protein
VLHGTNEHLIGAHNYNRLNGANKHKIVLMGDSHSRGNIINISHHLGSNFDLFGVIKPGASIIDIVPQNTAIIDT